MPHLRPLRSGEPRRVGPYRLLGCLGEGGQGAVYQGTDAAGRNVAVKLLHTRLSSDADASARFLREAKAAARVAQFCTARVLDAGVHEGISYIVSELVEGESLERLVRRDGPRDAGAVERLAVSTATALVAIHRAGVVHRDFKPQNVMLGPDGVRVIDFGIAKMSDASASTQGMIVGTPAYMSPEQIVGQEVGPASDMFSWAATLVFAATGRVMFGADNVPAVLHRVLHHEPELPPLSEPLGGLVARALAKDPRRRPEAHEVVLTLVGHDPQAAALSPLGGESTEGASWDGASLGEVGHSIAVVEPPEDDIPSSGPIEPAPRKRLGLRLASATAAVVVAMLAVVVLLTSTRGGLVIDLGDTDAVAVALSGETALVAEENAVTFWDVAEDRHLSLSHVPSQVADIVSMTASGDFALTGHADGVVGLWRVGGSHYDTALEGHTKRVHAVAIGTLDGKPVGLSGGADHTIRVWDLEARTSIRTISGQIDEVRALAVTELGGTPVAVSLDGSDNVLRLWDLRTGQQLGKPLAREAGNGITVGDLDGRPVVVSSNLAVWDLKSRKLLRQIDAPGDTWPNVVAVTRIGQTPVIVSTVQGADVERQGIQAWDLRTGEKVGDLIGTDTTNSLAVGTVRGKPMVLARESTSATLWPLSSE
ncbi:serine/threonine-protein kinase [Nonomuraea sp. NPDC003804]|uniref:WD40 repeat domain-containing serine/threonine protein kinase n=1 Tax=Nonomuraea sp. NPDC003804 TaxID=3154547 RepID=UPI0033AFF074